MNRQFVLGVSACGLLVCIVWALASLMSYHEGASGEWVGTMIITSGYPRPTEADFVQHTLVPPVKAAVYLNLSSSDSFLQEYSGPGELRIAGSTAALPLRLGAFRIHPPETRAQGAFICKGFLEDGIDGSFTPDAIHIVHSYKPGTLDGSLAFTLDLHRGSKSEYEGLLGK